MKQRADIGIVAAVVNAVNEHDGSLMHLLRRWVASRQALRRDPATAMRAGRVPIPCACSRGTAESAVPSHQAPAAA